MIFTKSIINKDTVAYTFVHKHLANTVLFRTVYLSSQLLKEDNRRLEQNNCQSYSKQIYYIIEYHSIDHILFECRLTRKPNIIFKLELLAYEKTKHHIEIKIARVQGTIYYQRNHWKSL